MSIAYLNKRFIPLDKVKISILDRGFLYGDGVFETLRSYRGIVFRLEQHIERLFGSLKVLDIRLKINKRKLQKIVYRLLDKNRLKEAYIKIIVTRGKSRGLLIPSANAQPTLAIYVLPYKPIPRNVYKNGVKVNISTATSNEKSPVAGDKTLNYLHNILSRYQAKKKGFDDTILMNTKGFVSEASSSNVFLVKGKKIYTPCLVCGILPGITRAEVIRLAEKFLKGRVKETFIKTDDLYNADEVFFTNSLTEIVPVVKIDRHTVGKGIPGPVTRKLMGLFKDAVTE